jgi:hypothetical protein
MMPAFTDLTGLAGIASLMAAFVLLVPRIKQLPKPYLAILTATVFIVSLVPFCGMPLAGYVRGMVGDLSITTVVLAWAALLQPCCAVVGRVLTRHVGLKPDLRSNGLFGFKQRDQLLLLVAAAAMFLYPMTLGMSLYDPYRLGYGDMVFVALVLMSAIASWLLRSNLIGLCLALATLAWSLGWYESTNLWDYLIDPLVAIYAMSALVKNGAVRLLADRRSS